MTDDNITFSMSSLYPIIVRGVMIGELNGKTYRLSSFSDSPLKVVNSKTFTNGHQQSSSYREKRQDRPIRS